LGFLGFVCRRFAGLGARASAFRLRRAQMAQPLLLLSHMSRRNLQLPISADEVHGVAELRS